jgi:hypothetical protein
VAVLALRDEKTGQEWQVWPQADAVPPGAVHELGSYLFELRDAEDASTADLLIDDQKLEPLRTKDAASARWRWSPGFHAGIVEAEMRLPRRGPQRFQIVTDPDLRKLTRDHFESMVREILEDTFALFSASGFRKAVARGTGARPPAIARLEFLRSRIEELERVVAAIVRNPRQRLSAEDVSLPYHRATRATGPEIIRSLRGARALKEQGTPSRLPPPLRGFLPASIRTGRKWNSLDIPEHRQIGACLRAWAAWLTSAAEQLTRKKVRDQELAESIATWVMRCRGLARRVGALAAAPTFASPEPPAPGLHLSAIFRNDPAYRAFFRIWQDMNRGIAAVFGDFLEMPLARTWELYELWCFLRLARAGIAEFGGAGASVQDLFIRDAAGGLTIAAGAVTVGVGKGWSLCFQKQYREFWVEADGRGSFSRVMTPDIVASAAASATQASRLIILDAKYRIEDGLNDALGSIHTYRDALVEETGAGGMTSIVSAAYLLTPHIANGPAAASYRNAPMPARLFRPDYRSSFRFGAVSLRPGLSLAELRAVLRAIVADATGATP